MSFKNKLYTMENNKYCIILAGGKGKRLWPSSRENRPKQFLDFFGTGKTQLQQTYERMKRVVPAENILISTNIAYEDLIREQLPEVPSKNVMAEPVARNTAPVVAWGCYKVKQRCKDGLVVVVPSDQAIINEDAFVEDIRKAFNFVEKKDCLLTIGVTPTRPEPGYGYVQMGDEYGDGKMFEVKSFTEKPERDFATMFMQSGEFLWNTGIFLASTKRFIASFSKILSPVLSVIDNPGNVMTLEEEAKYIHENYPRYPNISVDYGILEKSNDNYVMKAHFGWADLGTWHSIYECMSRGENDNVVVGSDVILEDSTNNVIKLPEGRLAVINGLDGYIVAEEGNVLLICKKGDSSALIRKYVNQVRMTKGEEFV